MMTIKYINTGCMRGGAVFPAKGCMDFIEDGDPDVVVLVEASEMSDGFTDFSKMVKAGGYELYKEKARYDHNQVMICVRTKLKVIGVNELGKVAPQKFTGRGVGVNSVAASEVTQPDYLRITIENNGEPVDIIGARIPSYGKFKNGRTLTPTCYHAALCSFRQLLEALDRDTKDSKKTVVVMDGNNAKDYGSFYGPYDPEAYKGVQKNYNFHILRDEMFLRDFILKEGINDFSWNGIHLDHAFFKGIDVNEASVRFVNVNGFDHRAIKISF